MENAWILPDAVGGGDFRSEIVGTKGAYYATLSAPEFGEMYTWPSSRGRAAQKQYLPTHHMAHNAPGTGAVSVL